MSVEGADPIATKRRASNPRSSQSKAKSGGGARNFPSKSKQHQQPPLSILSDSKLKRRPSNADVNLLVSSGALIGSARVSSHMRPYMFDKPRMISLLREQYEREREREERYAAKSGRKTRTPLTKPPQFDTLESVFDMRSTWNQLNLAAMLLAGVNNTSNILIVASNSQAASGASSLARVLNAKTCIGRYVPGTVTNTNQKTFCEPYFIICASAIEDAQAIKESSYSNIPVIAFAESTANLTNVDVPIPCNARGRLSIGLMFYFLARQTLRHSGQLSYSSELPNLTPDHFVVQKVSRKSDSMKSANASGPETQPPKAASKPPTNFNDHATKSHEIQQSSAPATAKKHDFAQVSANEDW